jgi:hypothetical protein
MTRSPVLQLAGMRRCAPQKPCPPPFPDAGRRSSALLGDSAWLVQARAGGDAARVALERCDGQVKAVVVLEVQRAQVLLRPLQGCGPHRCVVRHSARVIPRLWWVQAAGVPKRVRAWCSIAKSRPQQCRGTRARPSLCTWSRCATRRMLRSCPEPVRSLEDAVRTLAKCSAAKQQLDRRAAAAVAALQQQPGAAGLQKLSAAIEEDLGPEAACGGAAGEAAEM